MSKTLISGETLKTIGQGALGAMTFGAYHQFTTNKLMELNNEKIEIQHKYFMDKMENKYKIDMDKYKLEMEKVDIQNKRLNEKIEKLEKKSWW
jgi:hypothetical protein